MACATAGAKVLSTGSAVMSAYRVVTKGTTESSRTGKVAATTSLNPACCAAPATCRASLGVVKSPDAESQVRRTANWPLSARLAARSRSVNRPSNRSIPASNESFRSSQPCALTWSRVHSGSAARKAEIVALSSKRWFMCACGSALSITCRSSSRDMSCSEGSTDT